MASRITRPTEQHVAAGQDYTAQLREWFQQPGRQASTPSEIARSLSIPTEGRASLRAALRGLESDGVITEGRGGRYLLRAAKPLAGNELSGHLLVRGSGRLFIPDREAPENQILLKKLNMPLDARLSLPGKDPTGWNGDRVVARISGFGDSPRKGAAIDHRDLLARVDHIIEHRYTTIPGTLVIKGQNMHLQPDDPLLPVIEVLPGGEAAQDGDKVVVKITRWPDFDESCQGTVARRLGVEGDRGIDVLGLIYKFNLPLEFPAEVIREAQAIPVALSSADMADREDWRGRHVITIDPFDAKDFDDAIAVSALPGGGWELGVHIADVSHYVRPGTALDREASQRGNSTYLVDRVIPMLPEVLSNGLCSLRPNEDKLTRVAVMEFDAKGIRRKVRFASAAICSRRRYTYEEAMAVLKAPPGADEDAQLLHRAWGLASLLRARRYREGALDLDFPEIKCVLDADGRPVRLARILHDESHQLIEEFMLAANEAVAVALIGSQRPALYRIHEEPDPAKLREFRDMLGAHGIKTGDLTNRSELQKALKAMEGRPEAPALKVALLKSLKRAVYSADSLGHYGLAMEHYTHFTSPIRRYADLIVHRVLGSLSHAPGKHRTPGIGALRDTASVISTTERNSSEAENESKRMKELEYFAMLAGQPEPPSFQATITRVIRAGLMIELDETQIRGLVPASDRALTQAFYDHAQECFSTRTGKTWKRGAIISVQPNGIERERSSVLFRLAGGSARAAEKRAGGSGREDRRRGADGGGRKGPPGAKARRES